jgi:hypothetical protein
MKREEMIKVLKEYYSKHGTFGPSLVTDFKSAVLLDDILDEAWLHYCSRSGGSKRTIKGDCVILTYHDETYTYTKDEYVRYIKKILRHGENDNVLDAFLNNN